MYFNICAFRKVIHLPVNTDIFTHIPRKKIETPKGLRHSADDGVESSLWRWQSRVQPRGRGECHCIPRISRMESPKSAGKSTFGQKKKVGRPQTEAVMDNFAPSKWFFGDLSDTGRIEPLAAHAGRSGRCLKCSAVKRLIQINSRPRHGGCWWNIDVRACHGSILRILLDDVVQNAINKNMAHQMGHFLSQCIFSAKFIWSVEPPTWRNSWPLQLRATPTPSEKKAWLRIKPSLIIWNT